MSLNSSPSCTLRWLFGAVVTAAFCFALLPVLVQARVHVNVTAPDGGEGAQLRLTVRPAAETGTFLLSNLGNVGVTGAEVDLGLPAGGSAMGAIGDGNVAGGTWTADVPANGTAQVTVYLDRADSVPRGLLTPTAQLDTDSYTVNGSAPYATQPGSYLSVDARMLGTRRPDDCLVLRVGDDGMNGDGIRKGDLLVVAEADWTDVSNGEMVGVLVQDQALARRFGFANGRIHLRPADRHYTKETFSPDDPACYVIGRVLGLMRML